MTRPRVVIAGLGETGVLTAVRLTHDFDVVGISAKPALVSGQELGLRLTRPQWWARDYHHPFSSLKGLDRARVLHGCLTGLDTAAKTVEVRLTDGTTASEPYDVLIISTGVANGFWRTAAVESADGIEDGIEAAHERLAASDSIAVIGGGAAAVSTAWNAAKTWPQKRVDLFFPGERGLPLHHGKVWTAIAAQLTSMGVGIHPGHRAVIPDGFACDAITADSVVWSTGQEPHTADAVIWAIGRARPNTDWLPAELLDDEGYVKAELDLSVPGAPGVFAIGDVASTDPLRSSARNFTFKLLARNVRAHLAGKPLKTFTPPKRRWGSIVGYQDDGLVVFAAGGQRIRFPYLFMRAFIQSYVVDRTYYRGIRRAKASSS